MHPGKEFNMFDLDFDPTVFTMNEHGLWCNMCGDIIAAPWNIDEDYQAPDCCPKCGWPDEFDPEAI